MVITKDVKLPTYQELTVEEADVSHATLRTAAPYLGKACESVNNEFMLCRQELMDPRACVDLGKEVTACALATLRTIKKHCLEEFNNHARCVNLSSGDFSYSNCRNTQRTFDSCMHESVGMARPDFGYFCRARVHDSPRPSPPAEPCPCQPKVADSSPSLPDSAPRPPARFGSRVYWMTE